ncbi:MAG TPA: class I SAM-dependent methyltransferase [Thermoplasmata archaeon]|nr:class I SAM-dependent methyltransferase [Thermoplasmata archaeon]
MSIHEAARLGFSRSSAEYDRGRPEYPPSAVLRLRQQLDLGPDSRVAELGAGTGKFTRALQGAGLAPIAVEPLGAMRSVLHQGLPEVPLIAGLAERLPFRAGRLDAVCAAQAFHWFELNRTLEELARVLRPGGGLGIVWNVRDETVAWQRQMSDGIERHRPAGLPTHRNTGWKEAIARDGRFSEVASSSEGWTQRCTVDELRARVSSISFVANLDPPARESLLREVLAVAQPDHVGDGEEPTFTIPYRTEVHWARRL